MSTGRQVGNMTKTKESKEAYKEVRQYSEALKMEVVKELDSGKLSVKEAMEFYDIAWSRTINRWQKKYGKDRRETRIVRVIMKNEQERIRTLEKALADKEIELMALRALNKVYEEDYGEDIKKKLSPEQLANLEKLKKGAKLA